jgi:hypothetical protein
VQTQMKCLMSKCIEETKALTNKTCKNGCKHNLHKETQNFKKLASKIWKKHTHKHNMHKDVKKKLAKKALIKEFLWE